MTLPRSLDFASLRAAMRDGVDPVELVAESCGRAAAAAREGIFTALVPEEAALRRARDLAEAARSGRALPLLGLTFSVKDNIHVAGMETTCNCSGLHLCPTESAPAVLALEAAGAVLVGKNTLDQFATGLNGTRSPDPLCRNAIDPRFIPGGSSSGSAVAVARDIVSFSLGTDTGGSGRVPAACNGIVGLKPTVGGVSARGLVYNSRFLDCIPVFARRSIDAWEVLTLIWGFDGLDPMSRPGLQPLPAEPSAPESSRLAVPRREQLGFEGDAEAERAFRANLEALRALGFTLTEIDFTPFEEASRLVFDSALVAERLVDYGQVFAEAPDTIHPAVRAAIEPGLRYSAREGFEAVYRLMDLRRRAERILAPYAALVLPTVATIFTIDEMLAEPMARNAAMGRYTYFVNPMDLCAVAVPGATLRNGLRSSLCFIGLAGADAAVAGLAGRFEAGSPQKMSAAA